MLKEINEICFDYQLEEGLKSQKIAIFGDPHIDAKGHTKKKFRDDIAYCVKNKIGVVFIGDLFDAMQGANDRRGSKGSVISQAYADDYFNQIVEYVSKEIAPLIKDLPFVLCLSGNHETKVTKYQEIDLLKMLKYDLFHKGVNNFYIAGYRTYLRLKYTRSKGSTRAEYVFLLHHGYNGGQRSKGILKADIMNGVYSSADCIATGHVHMAWSAPLYRLSLNKNGVEKKEEVIHLQVGSYKEDILNKGGGFAIEKGFNPGAIGGYIVDVEFKRVAGKTEKGKNTDRIEIVARETRM